MLRAQHEARRWGEAHGWTHWIANDVDRALVILLSHHTAGEKVRYSQIIPALRAHGLSVGRTAEILTLVGLLDDDRPSQFDAWLDSAAEFGSGGEGEVEALEVAGPAWLEGVSG
ncbi:hypothetical protein [Micromonospora olivasterospora]|uniref:Uncharacterized protein n=2 Tax=Micromonospora olivasterospora TaxID=1880 RepID=A0A562IAN6_MICOL|nr:hypothetical protein [Micromonospora olivasterospora]TWH67753.1 hypothetical protein JD77_02738 [Micromonospora olivasterospora]